MYICYSTRMAGWFTPHSTYSSVWKDAKQFALDEAIAFCRIHKNGNALAMFPVAIETLESI